MKARTSPRTASSNGSNHSAPNSVSGGVGADGVAWSMAWVPPQQGSEPTPPPEISTTSATRPEVVGDFVNLRESLGRQPSARACGHDRGIERVLNAGLECRVEKGEPANLVRSPVTGIKDVAQNDGAFGQRARLVGAQDVHAAEVLDGLQTTN